MRALLVLAALLALVAGACGSGTDDEAAPPDTTAAGMETTEMAVPAPKAPPIEGESLEGETVALADFRGRPVLVNVWSSW